MTKVEGYKCDYCKSLYDTSEEALKCEQNHIVITDIKSIYKKNDTFPKDVIIYLTNGERAYYSYDAHMG